MHLMVQNVIKQKSFSFFLSFFHGCRPEVRNIFPAVATGAFFWPHSPVLFQMARVPHTETSQTIRRKKKEEKDERRAGWHQSEEKVIVLFFTVCQFWPVLSAHVSVYLHLKDGEDVWERTKLLTLRGTLEQSNQLPTAAAPQLNGLCWLQYTCKVEMRARCLYEHQMYKEGQRWMFLFTWTCYIQLYI